MRTIYILAILVLLAVAVPAAPAHAGGVVTVCDEAHLLAALDGGGTVTFSCSGTIRLTAEIVIAADTTIDGSGQDVTISGRNSVRVFAVSPTTKLTLQGVTVAHGFVLGYGGGVYSDGGTVVILDCAFSDNLAPFGGGVSIRNGVLSVHNTTFSRNTGFEGGAILNRGDSTVANSTFFGNYGDYGGAIANYTTLTISNSTFAGNGAVEGGALFSSTGNSTVSNSTFSDNQALETGSSLAGSVTLRNTLVANSLVTDNCSGLVFDGGGNLSYPDTTCPGINADPLLGPLQDNGGPTWTMALGEGSAALDAADDAICAAPPVNNLDQRGFPRPWGAHCDIGAVEQVQEPVAVRLSTINAGSTPGAVAPTAVAALLLLALGGCAAWGRRHTQQAG